MIAIAATLIAIVENSSRQARVVRPRTHAQAVHLAQNSRFLSRYGRWADELQGAQLGLVAAERSGDRAAETRFRNWLGEVLITAERWDEALENLERALSLARVIPLTRQLATALNGIGLLRCVQGRFEEGLPYLHEVLTQAASRR